MTGRERERRALSRETTDRIPVGMVCFGINEPTRLEFERKTFSDALKMMAYRAESALTAAIAPHYKRAHQEARKLVGEVLRASGDMEVTDKEISLSFEPLSSPHRTAALRELCTVMTKQHATYPGTRLKLRYSVRAE